MNTLDNRGTINCRIGVVIQSAGVISLCHDQVDDQNDSGLSFHRFSNGILDEVDYSDVKQRSTGLAYSRVGAKARN